MARSQLLLKLLALLLLAGHARQAAAAATPAARQLTQVDNDAPQAVALPAAVMEALHNASRGLPPGAQLKAVVSGSSFTVAQIISPLNPVDGGNAVYLLTLPDDITDCTIANLAVTVQWVKCQGGITPQGTCTGAGPAASNELSLRLFSTQDVGQPTLVNGGGPNDNPTYGSGPTPGASFTVTFDDDATDPVGGGDPVSGTFRPIDSLSSFNGREARGRPIVLFVADSFSNGNPVAVQSWSVQVDCAQDVVRGEPPCVQGNFIGPGANFWGPKKRLIPDLMVQSAPASHDLVTPNDPVTGGWPDGCAKAFDACQAGTMDPTVFDTTCGCTLWACLNPCVAKECPVTGEGPVCPPQGLRAYYCNKLKDAGATCGDDAPVLPDDCDSLSPAAANAANKHARRNRA